MSVEALETGLRAIARRDCPCICCRNNAAVAQATLDAHAHQQLRTMILPQPDGNAVLVDAAEGGPLFHHSV